MSDDLAIKVLNKKMEILRLYGNPESALRNLKHEKFESPDQKRIVTEQIKELARIHKVIYGIENQGKLSRLKKLSIEIQLFFVKMKAEFE